VQDQKHDVSRCALSVSGMTALLPESYMRRGTVYGRLNCSLCGSSSGWGMRLCSIGIGFPVALASLSSAWCWHRTGHEPTDVILVIMDVIAAITITLALENRYAD